MRLQELFDFCVQQGIANDPRGTEQVEKELARTKKDYEKMSEKDKKYFDADKLNNPYADTRILYGDPHREINSILIGVDMEGPEVLLADRMRQTGKPVDLIIAHHPEGRAMAQFHEVMHMQADILASIGVSINVAEDILSERIKEVERRVMPVNHNRAVDIARLLDIPMVCIHTPTDNAVNTYLQKLMDEKKPYLLEDVVEILMEIPEYQEAAQNNNPANVLIGAKKNRAGQVFVDMTGGTGGSKESFQYLANTQVGTVVGMHIGEDHRKEAIKNHINVVIAGHISSDTLGINLMLDKLIAAKGPLEINACSGFKRVSRN
ncbi:MAG: NGG1p interacting factor NIF3 [Candidatus Schekmanbacteria bacterium]|nr:NGG1p interacting factor NIF3 [Candidatus Schekmanbacteria bacterium]